MSDQLRILDELEAELARAVEADERAHTARRRRWPRPHGLTLVLLIGGLSATTVAAAATNLFGLADPIPAPRPTDAPVESRPIPSTAVLAGAAVKDPDDLPPWDVRVSRTETGELCSAVGQLAHGQFGIVGLDRKFRALPVGAADACGSPPTGDDVQVGARAAVGGGGLEARTFVVGIAGPDVARVALRRAGVDTELPLRRDRAFLAVLEGQPDLTRPHLRVTGGDGKTRSIRLADSGDIETPDPDGGLPWAIKAGPASRFVNPTFREMRMGAPAPPKGARCVEARRQPNALAGSYASIGVDAARTPITCRLPGQDEPVVALIRRLSPGDMPGEATSWMYGTAPARTVAVGLAGDAVVRLELQSPGGSRPVPLAPKTRAFAVILDGHTDPTTVTLRARLRDGRVVTTSTSNATFLRADGRPTDLGPNPPWRDHRPYLQDRIAPAIDRTKDVGSDRIGPTVEDPAGGPPWAAHAWTATRARNGGEPLRLLCATYGPLVDGVVQRPSGVGYAKAPPTAGALQRACVAASLSPGAMGRAAYGARPEVYVDDPASLTPKLARVVLSAVYPGVQRAEVLLPGGKEEPATVGPYGATLALLPPSAARPGSMLRLRLHFAGGLVRRTSYTVFSPPRRPVRARAVDPKGGAGWVVRGTALRTPWVPGFPARDVDGRSASIDDWTGEVQFSYGDTFHTPTHRPTRRDPIWFSRQLFTDRLDSESPSPADTARRTLPGRTAIIGSAASGVTRVTIETPRDVRTVRPSKVGGIFMVVYDGRFTQGRIRVTATGPGIRKTVSQRADGEF